MQPEHYDFATAAFLPVSLEVCQALLDDASALNGLSDPELAALLVIQNLAQAREQVLDPTAAERVLVKLLHWSVHGPHSAGVTLTSEAQRLFDAHKLYFGLELLKGSRLHLMDAEEVAERAYLLPDGTWDTRFRAQRHQAHNPFSQQAITGFNKERWLTTEQDKLLRVLRANPDEDLHVQGYAGIGKSYLLGALIDCLPKGRVLALARTPNKLDALRRRIGGGSRAGKTFAEFAQALISGPGGYAPRSPARLPSKRAVAERLAIMGFRQYDGEKTLDIALEVLKRYCESREHSLSAQHLPHFAQALSRADAQVLLEYTSRLWLYVQDHPAWDRQTGFATLLLLKRASLSGHSVPSRYSHVIVDESQDMPGPLLQIIERGRQVLITLGDEYQRADGPGLRRGRQVRQRDIAFSVRCGQKVEKLINPLIGMHSNKSKLAFEGAGSVEVGIEYYPLDFVPPPGCVVLTASLWDSMKWALQLADNQCQVGFADNPAMKRFMHSAVQLFRADLYGAGSDGEQTHPAFAHALNWRQVQDEHRYDESFLWVEARLQAGFRIADLNGLATRFSHDPGSLLLMPAQEAGGQEFDRVLLTQELMALSPFQDAYAFDSRLCAVYIALSRARRHLYLPYDVEEWVAYHKGRTFRQSHGY